MEEKQKDINEALETTRGWNILVMIFVMPLFLGLCILAPYLAISFGTYMSKNSITFLQPLTELEYQLIIPEKVFGISFFVYWAMYMIMYIISKRNRIYAYILNLLVLFTLIHLSIFGLILGLQFFVPFLIIRIIYWLAYSVAVVYIIYSLITKSYTRVFDIDKEKIKKYTNVILALWFINFIAGILISGFKNLLAHLLLAILPIAPIFLIIILISLSKSTFSSLFNLKVVNKNQEKYREEYGYTIEEWYGKKSKMYKEYIKKQRGISK